MTGFMNAELERIRDNLQCGHCGAVFKGSDSQARKVKYEKLVVYCSTVCRHASLRNKYSKPVPNRGPCPTCGADFFSKKEKKYCSLNCYVNSEQFKSLMRVNATKTSHPATRAKMGESHRTGEIKLCLECSTEIYRTPSNQRKFCSKTCYRSYMAKRFDRWIANPEGLALPQCYDEFLDRDELTCPIDGCSWHGKHLSLHVNQAHGLIAQEFKRAAGFNLKTGVISKPLAEALSLRPNIGVALNQVARGPAKAQSIRYRSKEASEHQRKARATADIGPPRACAGCGAEFNQSTQFGRALYCSTECRDATYAGRKKARAKKRIRRADGTFEWVDNG